MPETRSNPEIREGTYATSMTNPAAFISLGKMLLKKTVCFVV